MIKLFFSIFTILFITESFTQTTKAVTRRNGEFILPPGNIKVDSNLFFDQHEITNFNWQEYQYYLARVFGKSSKEYKTALPNTAIWTKIDTNLKQFSTNYLKHPAYNDYPVVGVSHKQASDFSKWRSDRVFQYLLIKNEVIPMATSNSADSAFTIEKYFTGDYLHYQPDSNYLTYPYFELIDSISYSILSHFADSINILNMKYCKKDSLFSVKHLGNYYQYLQRSNPEFLRTNPTTNVDCSCRRKKAIPHLYGNVSELTAHETVLFGSGYGDSTTVKTTRQFTEEQLNNKLIGFRNKCTYRTWPN